MKKFTLYILILIVLVGLFSSGVKTSAQQSNCLSPNVYTQDGRCLPPSAQYILLAPLPCAENTPGCNYVNGKWEITTFDPTSNRDGTNPALGRYLNLMIKIIIGLSAVLAVVMIVIGGMEYMTTELVSSKEAGKEKVRDALLGLLLALGAYALLFTINPDLLSTDINIPEAKVTVDLRDLGGESSESFQGINRTILQARGITSCNGSGGKAAVGTIGQQFIGKTVYSMTNRNRSTASTLYFDCSSFVAQVYACANLPSPGNTTLAIFSSGNTRAVTGATYDFTQLNPGDLVGWKKGDNGSGKQVEGNGHVMIYLGGGKVLHSSGTAGSVVVGDLGAYKDRITYVKWP